MVVVLLLQFFSFNTFESVYWLFLLLTKLVLFLIKKNNEDCSLALTKM